MGLGKPLDPREAGLHGAEEGLADALGARLVPGVGLVDVEFGAAPNPNR